MDKEYLKKLDEERGKRMAKQKEKDLKKSPYISFGVDLLDLSYGGGDDLDKGGMGIKVGDMVNVFGGTGVGKSFLLNEFIASAKRTVESGGLAEWGIDKFIWHYGDAEEADNFDTEKLYGFEINPPNKPDVPKTVEDYCFHIQSMLRKLKENELLVYIIDSLDALTSRKNLEMNEAEVKAFEKGKEVNKGSFDLDKNKFLAQKFFSPIIESRKGKNAIIIITSQIRDNVGAGMFEKKTTTSSTKVVQFYCDTRVELLAADKYTKKIKLSDTDETFERAIGGSVRCNPVKVRHERPYRIVQFDYLYSYGLDNVGSNVDFLYGLRDEKYKLKTGDKYKNLAFPPKTLSDAYEKATVPNIRAWTKEQLPEAGVKSTTTKDALMELIEQNTLMDSYREVFGTGFGRAELINYIVENDLEDELSKRVRIKWERIEKPVAENNRKRKW